MKTGAAGAPRLGYYRRNLFFYLMLLPVAAYYLLFHYGPMVGVILAFKNYVPRKGIWGSAWVGLKHFQVLFGSNDFRMVMVNTILLSLYKLIWGFPAPILLSLLINEMNQRHVKKAVQTVTYMPHFLSWVIVAGLVRTVFGEDGPVNAAISNFGKEPVFFLIQKGAFRSILVGANIWKEVGWGTLIYLATIAGIDPELYESAVLDGAGRFKQTLHITLPSMLPTIVILLIMRTGSILNAGFEDVLLLQNAMIRDVAEVIDTYVYKQGIQTGITATYAMPFLPMDPLPGNYEQPAHDCLLARRANEAGYYAAMYWSVPAILDQQLNAGMSDYVLQALNGIIMDASKDAKAELAAMNEALLSTYHLAEQTQLVNDYARELGYIK